MAWSIEGIYFESCSCVVPCPCTISLDLGADLDYCRVVLAFNIAKGDVDGVDVGGVGVAMFANTPKVMSDGNWNVGLFIDENASDEQTEALTQEALERFLDGRWTWDRDTHPSVTEFLKSRKLQSAARQ